MSDRACQNRECEHFGTPTRLMGGCECGAPLEKIPDGPTVEQMENVALTMGFGSLLVLRDPVRLDGLRALHALVQRAASGNKEAALRLAMMRAAVAGGDEGNTP